MSSAVTKEKSSAGEEKSGTHQERLNGYFLKRELEGLGVPQSSVRLGYPSLMFISQETNIPRHTLDDYREFINEWIKRIGLGEPVPPSVLPTVDCTLRGNIYLRRVDAYLERLRRTGKKIPEDPGKLGHPYLERVASDSDIPASALQMATAVRRRLLEGVTNLGLKIYSNDSVWNEFTYGDLLEEGGICRKSELEGKPKAGQQLSNTKTSLRHFFQQVGKSKSEPVGPEFLEHFERNVREITGKIKNESSRRKFSTEIHRWPRLCRQALTARGLPANFRAALRMAIKRSGISVRRLAEAVEGGTGSTIFSWINGSSAPSRDHFPLIERIEEALELPPKTLLSLLTRRLRRRLRREDYPEFAVWEGEQIPLRDNNKRVMTR